MDTPWAGDGRGLVFQKMFSRDGKLIASCVQEVSTVRILLCVEVLTVSRALFDCAKRMTAKYE
jgi:acyl-CoA thioesterase 8